MNRKALTSWFSKPGSNVLESHPSPCWKGHAAKHHNNNNNNNGNNRLRPTTTTLLRNSKTYTKKKAQCTELFTASLVAAAEESGTYVEAADLVIIKCKLPNELGARTTIHNVNPCLFCTTILPFPQRSSSKPAYRYIFALQLKKKNTVLEQRWSLSGPSKLRRPNIFLFQRRPRQVQLKRVRFFLKIGD